VRWKWNQRTRDLGEAGLKAEMVVRSDPEALQDVPAVPRARAASRRRCTECDASLAGVRAPGLTRVVANLIPGSDRDDVSHPARERPSVRGRPAAPVRLDATTPRIAAVETVGVRSALLDPLRLGLRG
jgi:hypothetical protein